MISIVKQSGRFISNYYDRFVIPLLLIMILKGIIFPLEKREPSKDTILIQSDSLYTSTLEKDTRLQILLNAIHLHQEFVVQFAIGNESLRMQGRLLFITLFSALITALYSIKRKDQRKIMAFMAILVGLFWYGINVHKLDIENRGSSADEMIFNTETKLLNLQPENNRIYYLDFEKLQNTIKKGEDNHQIRKIERFFSPDISDIVFNMIPLLIFVFIYNRRKHIDGSS